MSLLVQAVLDVGAVEGERNVIEVKTKTFQGKTEVVTTIASLTLGNNDMVGIYLSHRDDLVYILVYILSLGPF